jgi:hypothetical protein
MPAPSAGQNGAQNRAILPPQQQEEETAEIEEPAPVVSSEPEEQVQEFDAVAAEIEATKEHESAVPSAVQTVTLIKPLLDLSHIDARNRPHLVWSETPLALAYVIEEADNPDFHNAKEFRVKPDDTRWNPRWGRSGRLFYRIRAIGDGDSFSPWSETLPLRFGDTPRR